MVRREEEDGEEPRGQGRFAAQAIVVGGLAEEIGEAAGLAGRGLDCCLELDVQRDLSELRGRAEVLDEVQGRVDARVVQRARGLLAGDAGVGGHGVEVRVAELRLDVGEGHHALAASVAGALVPNSGRAHWGCQGVSDSAVGDDGA